jgi:transposase-like protein
MVGPDLHLRRARSKRRMKLLPVNCPVCNSRQRFAPHKRIVGNTYETFIRCKMCHTESVIESGKPRRAHTHRHTRSVPEVR